jgi:gamma-butyrobetaine dioxygenase
VENDVNDGMMVYYAPPFQAPLEAEPSMVEPFYRAFSRLESIMKEPDLMFKILLKPRDCVIFANRRVLHGRNAFDAASGNRHLRGTYVGWDEFKDKLRLNLRE